MSTAADNRFYRTKADLIARNGWDEELEARAKVVYAAMPYDGPDGTEKPNWVRHGNSLKQDEARSLARSHSNDHAKEAK